MIPTAVLTYLNPDYCDPLVGFGTSARLALFWVLSGIWIAVGTLYCFSIFVVVIYKLATHKQMENHGSKLTGRHLKRIVTRLILYPLAPVISLFPYMLTYTISPYVSPESNRVIDVMQLTCLSLQGLINFVFFMADPALPDILSEVRGSVETFSIYGSTTKCSDNEEDKLEIHDLASTSTNLATRPTGPTPQPAQARRPAEAPVRTGAFQSAFPIFGSVSHQTIPERHWVKLV
ncbi:hypothetical protein CONCODRAFT_78737 [Conidiobolus coronatus NRRL 28638]|uniref:Uncharacterized protein n=1 Tax=Conidiobolus coronatus (strain ATCC 28846 / CBS 209.66 / NRRL 28638) TaxID=796925 RepID=A0A137P6L9_CONC2|nr:hypothetical protein CONCODRAFT_78737 [Conidiobolus coronatus NRRL 28638]|eukprot:KXN70609.1 hypothetical protein CONCODRAFT_78737 [Conidiobolus coronatus NRRL 28638]